METKKKTIRRIGVVKWFYNKTTQEEYGFIEVFSGGDVYVNKKTAYEGIKENDLVIVKLKADYSNEKPFSLQTQLLDFNLHLKNILSSIYFNYQHKGINLLLERLKIKNDDFWCLKKNVDIINKWMLEKINELRTFNILTFKETYPLALILNYINPLCKEKILSSMNDEYLNFFNECFNSNNISKYFIKEIYYKFEANLANLIRPKLTFNYECELIADELNNISKISSPEIYRFVRDKLELMEDFYEDFYEILSNVIEKSIPDYKYLFWLKYSHLQTTIDVECYILEKAWTFKDEFLLKTYQRSDKLLKKNLINTLINNIFVNGNHSKNIIALKLIANYFNEYGENKEFTDAFKTLQKNLKEISEVKTFDSLFEVLIKLSTNKQDLYDSFLEKFFALCSHNLKIDLWLNGYYNKHNDTLLTALIFAIENNYKANDILSKIEEIPTNILTSLVIQINEIMSEYSYNLFKKIVPKLTDKDILNKLVNKLNGAYTLRAWRENYLLQADINKFCDGFIQLSIDEQKEVIVNLISNVKVPNKYKIDVFSRLIKNINSSSDYSISVLIWILHQQLNQNHFYTDQMISFILQLLSNGLDVENKLWFLEKCEGRTIKPGGDRVSPCIKYCEGRLVIDQKTKEAIKVNDHVYWWCQNSRCYQNMLGIKGESLSNNSLYFMILKINPAFTIDNYIFLLGFFNKYYIYLEHLKCRACKGWLNSVDHGNYGKNRVSTFCCNNKLCKEYKHDIYINHCHNKNCLNIVDSRDSKKCSNGWVICNSCLSCCSTDKIKIRQYIFNITNQHFKGNTFGHRDSKQICCPKCSNIMSFRNSKIDSNSFNQLVSNLENEIKILQKGYQRDGKFEGTKWFKCNRGNKNNNELLNYVSELRKSGISVKSLNSKEFMISALYKEKTAQLVCTNSNCNNFIDLNYMTEPERRKYYYHTIIREHFGKNEYDISYR